MVSKWAKKICKLTVSLKKNFHYDYFCSVLYSAANYYSRLLPFLLVFSAQCDLKNLRKIDNKEIF